MLLYTVQEYTQMVQLYYENNRNARVAGERFVELNPNLGRHPARNVILGAVRRFHENANVFPRNEGGRPRRIAPNVEENILAQFTANPRVSTRGVARTNEISHSTIHRALAEDGMHPYHFTRVQRLVNGDYQRRVEYCNRLLQQNAADPNLISSVLWTDECTFTRDGVFNFHNYHYWEHDNPHLTWDGKSQHRFKENVWAGLIDNQLVGPVFLPAAINAQNYLDFLMYELPDLLVNIIDERPITFMHDGCPAHTAAGARDWLTESFGADRWIGNNAPVWRWPARSPDHNPCDFYLWGAIKEKVYFNQIETPQQLRASIENAFADMADAGDVIRKATRSVVQRAQRCINAQGGHFEHLPNN